MALSEAFLDLILPDWTMAALLTTERDAAAAERFLDLWPPVTQNALAVTSGDCRVARSRHPGVDIA